MVVAIKKQKRGAPTMLLWAKNPTAAAQDSAEVGVPSPAWHSRLKDPVLPMQLLRRLQFWLRSDSWSGNSVCCGVAKKGKKRNKKCDIADTISLENFLIATSSF